MSSNLSAKFLFETLESYRPHSIYKFCRSRFPAYTELTAGFSDSLLWDLCTGLRLPVIKLVQQFGTACICRMIMLRTSLEAEILGTRTINLFSLSSLLRKMQVEWLVV